MKINRHSLADFMSTEGARLTDLAAATGISVSFLSELRSGTKTEASEKTIKTIADALHCHPRSLILQSEEVVS